MADRQRPIMEGVSQEAIDRMRQRSEGRTLNFEDHSNVFGQTPEDFERQLREQVGEPSNQIGAKHNIKDIATHIVDSGDDRLLQYFYNLATMNKTMAEATPIPEEKEKYTRAYQEFSAFADRLKAEIQNVQVSRHQQNPNPVPNPVQNTGAPDSPEIEARKNGLRAMLNLEYEKLAEIIKNCLLNLDLNNPQLTQEYQAVNSEINQKLQSERVLSEAQKEEIRRQASSDFYRVTLINKLGKSACQLIFNDENCEQLCNKINKLLTYNTVNEAFKNDYSEFIGLVDKMQQLSITEGIRIYYDEESANIEITFPEGIIGPISKQVVTNEVLHEIKTGALSRQPQSNPEPNPNQVPNPVQNPNLDSPEEKQRFMAKLLELKSRILSRYAECIKKLQITPEFISVMEEEQNLTVADTNPYDLTQPVINELVDKSRILQDLVNMYGIGFDTFIREVMSYYHDVDTETIKTVQPGTSEFISEYQKMFDSIVTFMNKVKAMPAYPNFINEIKFDDKTQSLIINYKNPNIPDFNLTVVPEEVLARMNAQTQPAQNLNPNPVVPNPNPAARTNPVVPNPVVPNPNTSTRTTSVPNPVVPNPASSQGPTVFSPINQVYVPDSKEEAINTYVAEIEHYNDLMRELNRINRELEVVAIYDFPSNETIEEAISKEKEAKQLDNDLKQMRIVLSRYRLEYRQKHREYIFQNPRANAAKLEEARFSGELMTFINQQDSLSMEAEQRVIELCNVREQNKNDRHLVMSTTNDINLLLEFIESRNSLIGRRIVAEAKDNNINIVSMLEDRRVKKAASREILRKAKMGENLGMSAPSARQEPASEPRVRTNPESAPRPKVEPKPKTQPKAEPAGKVVRLQLKLNPNVKQKVNRQNGTILPNLDGLTVSIMKNKLRIKFSKTLKDKLKALSSKVNISLVNNDEYRKRTTIEFDPQAKEQELKFADGRDIDPNAYHLEIRTPNGKGTKLEYVADLEETVTRKR